MEERNTQQDQVNMMQDQMPADESGLGGDFEEKKKTGKKKWLLAGGVIGLLAVVGIVALAGTMLFQSNQAKFVRALAEAFTSRPEMRKCRSFIWRSLMLMVRPWFLRTATWLSWLL